MKVLFMGTPKPAVACLSALVDAGHEIVGVWTQPDRPSGRGKMVSPSPVKSFALEKGLDVFQPEKLRSRDSLAKFEGAGADIAVVVAYGRILSEAYLDTLEYGAINVHFSLLPQYRGAAPVNWAIVNGETQTGVTTMLMDKGLDTGDILLQSSTKIGERENSIELMCRLSEIGATTLIETLSDIRSIVPRKQDERKATYAPIMEKSDGIIDWGRSASEISNRVRGFQPFPKSTSKFRGKGVTIWSALPGSFENGLDAEIGEIVKVDSSAILVKCGKDSYLAISEIQFEGKNRMTAIDAVNGFQLKAGEKFANLNNEN